MIVSRLSEFRAVVYGPLGVRQRHAVIGIFTSTVHTSESGLLVGLLGSYSLLAIAVNFFCLILLCIFSWWLQVWLSVAPKHSRPE